MSKKEHSENKNFNNVNSSKKGKLSSNDSNSQKELKKKRNKLVFIEILEELGQNLIQSILPFLSKILIKLVIGGGIIGTGAIVYNSSGLVQKQTDLIIKEVSNVIEETHEVLSDSNSKKLNPPLISRLPKLSLDEQFEVYIKKFLEIEDSSQNVDLIYIFFKGKYPYPKMKSKIDSFKNKWFKEFPSNKVASNFFNKLHYCNNLTELIYKPKNYDDETIEDITLRLKQTFSLLKEHYNFKTLINDKKITMTNSMNLDILKIENNIEDWYRKNNGILQKIREGDNSFREKIDFKNSFKTKEGIIDTLYERKYPIISESLSLDKKNYFEQREKIIQTFRNKNNILNQQEKEYILKNYPLEIIIEELQKKSQDVVVDILSENNHLFPKIKELKTKTKDELQDSIDLNTNISQKLLKMKSNHSKDFENFSKSFLDFEKNLELLNQKN